MANRLSVIATRTGDDGTTGLGTVPAAPRTPRVAALGDVDELNSAIGLLLTETLPEDVAADLLAIQHDLFDMGAELCIPPCGAERGTDRPPGRPAGPLQRGAAALARVHPARRLAYRRACARGARDLPARGTGRGGAGAHRQRQCAGKTVFEPAVRPAVRAGAASERRGRQNRCLLEQQPLPARLIADGAGLCGIMDYLPARAECVLSEALEDNEYSCYWWRRLYWLEFCAGLAGSER